MSEIDEEVPSRSELAISALLRFFHAKDLADLKKSRDEFMPALEQVEPEPIARAFKAAFDAALDLNNEPKLGFLIGILLACTSRKTPLSGAPAEIHRIFSRNVKEYREICDLLKPF